MSDDFLVRDNCFSRPEKRRLIRKCALWEKFRSLAEGLDAVGLNQSLGLIKHAAEERRIRLQKGPLTREEE